MEVTHVMLLQLLKLVLLSWEGRIILLAVRKPNYLFLTCIFQLIYNLPFISLSNRKECWCWVCIRYWIELLCMIGCRTWWNALILDDCLILLFLITSRLLVNFAPIHHSTWSRVNFDLFSYCHLFFNGYRVISVLRLNSRGNCDTSDVLAVSLLGVRTTLTLRGTLFLACSCIYNETVVVDVYIWGCIYIQDWLRVASTNATSNLWHT